MRRVAVLAGLLLSTGCASDPARDQPPDAQSQRVRDSVIGASKLPGAAGVRGALRAVDSAAVRRQHEDSIAGAP